VIVPFLLSLRIIKKQNIIKTKEMKMKEMKMKMKQMKKSEMYSFKKRVCEHMFGYITSIEKIATMRCSE
tara:strand:- start:831 stop:1037 length:207 start_codon:yes stop_codon:yes gene_type:complete